MAKVLLIGKSIKERRAFMKEVAHIIAERDNSLNILEVSVDDANYAEEYVNKFVERYRMANNIYEQHSDIVTSMLVTDYWCDFGWYEIPDIAKRRIPDISQFDYVVNIGDRPFAQFESHVTNPIILAILLMER